MKIDETLLGDFDAQQFLDQYWQQKPLLIRQALPQFSSPISPDELAGLACESEVEARLIFEKPAPGICTGDDAWQLFQGPFSEQQFQQLPESHYTLLVQAVDLWVPEMSELVDKLNFLPPWRFDDLMISYAPEHGSVGPHFDQYDVFLLQGYGRRQWQLGQQCDDSSPLLSGTDLSILQHFEPQQSWIVEPGDLLYIPPGLAHHGVALEDCLTYSFGFRAPSQRELLLAIADRVALQMSESLRYRDQKPTASSHNQLPNLGLKPMTEQLQAAMQDRRLVNQCFGQLVTEPKYPEQLELPQPAYDASEILQALQHGAQLLRSEHARWAYYLHDDGVDLFFNGQHLTLPEHYTKLAQHICSRQPLDTVRLLNSEVPVEVWCQLVNLGALYLD